MSPLIVIGLGLAAAIALLLRSRPERFEVSRSAWVAAPPEKVFPHINDLTAMNRWNPFAKPDATTTALCVGPASGPGAGFVFAGGRSGAGRLQIERSAPPSHIDMTLQMDKPIAAHNHMTFALAPESNGTRVTWTMSSRNSLLTKLLHLVINIDRIVGRQFATGLNSLKVIVET